jgi:hypothetical protein
MQSFIQSWGQKTGAVVLLLALVLSAAACGIKSQDSPGQTAVVLDLRSAAEQSAAITGLSASGLIADSTRLVGLLQITAADLPQPVQYLFPDLHMGSVQQILVPSGTGRTFELWIYEIPAPPVLPNTFPATLLVTLTPRELRTLDLAGEVVTLELVMTEDPFLGSIGSYNGDGYIQMDRAGTPEPVPGACGVVVEATLIDSAFNGLELGPFPLNIGLDPTFLDGEYLITQVPTGRSFKLKIGNPGAGWNGESDQTLVSSTVNPNPINVVLTGLQPLALATTNALVGDGMIGESVRLQPSGGYGAYNFTSLLYGMSVGGIVSISSWGLYTVTGTFGEDTVDTVTMSDACSPNLSTVKAQVYWYMVPLLYTGGGAVSLKVGSPSKGISSSDAASGPISGVQPPYGGVAGGDSIWLYGQGFDNNTQVFFNATQISSVTFESYGALNVITPSWPSEQYVDVRVFNPRSNALFPDFKGFDSIYPGAFQYTAGTGCPPLCKPAAGK